MYRRRSGSRVQTLWWVSYSALLWQDL